MIFSHAPAGFIATFATRYFWNKKLTKKQTYILYLIGIIAGIFPDIDVIYYYLINASTRHRELITHSPFFYILIWIILYIIAYLTKKQILKSLGLIIFTSSLSHFILDSITTGIPWFYPFSTRTWGLLNLPWFNFQFIYEHLFIFIFSIEALIFLIAVVILTFWKGSQQIFLGTIFVSILVFIFWIFLLINITPHLANGRIDIYYKDLDKDGIINMKDQDVDGDGILNIKDADANGNGESNLEEILKEAKKMEGIWYDKTEGKFGELFTRLGLIINADAVKKPYEHAGIFLKTEMISDFEQHPKDYTNTPRNALFSRNPKNIYTYLKNNDMLVNANEDPKLGDIVFYGDQAGHVALVVDIKNKNNFDVLEADPSHITKRTPNHEVVARKGEIKAFGRILK